MSAVNPYAAVATFFAVAFAGFGWLAERRADNAERALAESQARLSECRSGRMTKYVKDDHGWDKLFADIKAADGLDLDVGIVDGAVAEYAAANEYGTRTIPSRPWMRTTFDERSAAWQERFAKAVKAGRSVQRALYAVGLVAVSDLRKKIASKMAPPNAESTIS